MSASSEENIVFVDEQNEVAHEENKNEDSLKSEAPQTEHNEVTSGGIDESCREIGERSMKTGNGDDTNVVSSTSADYAANMHYEDDVAIYTDPASQFQYVWSNDKSEWIPRLQEKPETEDTDKEPEQGEYGYEGETHTYTDADGVVYLWDVEKNAWFPKLDEEFMARYQLSYGVHPPQTAGDVDTIAKKKEMETANSKRAGEITEGSSVAEDNKEVQKADGKRKAPQEPTWFDLPQEQNTKVYVTGLPNDITEEEFIELMSKCGLVERDSATQKMKIKLYMDSNGYPKGDALCTYIRVESVDLALNLLDGSDLRGHRISVQRAKFEMKGDYNPALKPKKKRKKDKEKQKKMKEKLFDWRPEKMRGERSKHERVVVLRNLFEPKLFDEQVELILEFQQDLREECEKLGEVRRVVLYDRHPEGIAQITMAEPEQADAVVKLMNGRWFNKRQLKSEIWDGKTKFKIGETDSEITQRLSGWDKFLDGEGANNNKKEAASETKSEMPNIVPPPPTLKLE